MDPAAHASLYVSTDQGAVAPLGQAGIRGSGGHVGIGESFMTYTVTLTNSGTGTQTDNPGEARGLSHPGRPQPSAAAPA